MSEISDPHPGHTDQFRQLFLKLRINDQIKWYKERCAEYQAAHRQIIIVRNVLLAAAAVAGGIGPFVPSGMRAILGLVAALLAALATAVTAFETLMGFPRLEKLYGDAMRNLERAAIDWCIVDPTTDLAPEVERVEDIFRSERGQWGQLLVTAAKPAAPREKGPLKEGR